MTASVTVAAPAKINLQLGVGAARADGYHSLATVYQAIGLYDEVTVACAEETTLEVVSDGVDVSDVPTDSSNLALRAAALLASRAGNDARVAMSIRKRIPVAGGMAGGSTDAAGALVACDALWGLQTSREDLLSLGAELGSDVPFCLLGGTVTGTGRGEVVAEAADTGEYWWVVALPGGGLSTPAVFGEFDRLSGAEVPEPEISRALLDALSAGSTLEVAGLLSNDLEAPALSLRPDLADVLAQGRAAGALAAMVSGSGPTCLVLAADEPGAVRIRDVLARAGVSALVARGPVPGAHVVTPL